MRFLIAIGAFVLAATSTALAQAPKGSPPIFKVVVKTEPDKGLILFKDTIYTIETVFEKRSVVKDIVFVEIEVPVNRIVPVEVTAAIDVRKSRVITSDGKQLPIDEVWKRIKANTVVVISGDNNTPDPAFLRALSAETVVIVPLPTKGVSITIPPEGRPK
jgi:hypothetical protein